MRRQGRSCSIDSKRVLKRPMSRIAKKFADLKDEGRAAFIPFVMAGDPDLETSLALIKALPGAGADLIELGVCFTDPMADGPAIQAAGLRALKAGQTLRKTLKMVSAFRKDDQTTPIILMGYFNPFLAFGVEAFLQDAKTAGVDGLIMVDLPPEEDTELCLPARAAGLDFIKLATPTTDAARMPMVLQNSGGFIYYVSVAGVTGQRSGEAGSVEAAIDQLRQATGLPIAVGFGIKTAEKAQKTAEFADAVVVGSALVEKVAEGLEASGEKTDTILNPVLNLAREIGTAVRAARGVTP